MFVSLKQLLLYVLSTLNRKPLGTQRVLDATLKKVKTKNKKVIIILMGLFPAHINVSFIARVNKK